MALRRQIVSAILIAMIVAFSAPLSRIASFGHAQASPALYVADYLGPPPTDPDSNGVSLFSGNPGDKFSVAVFMSGIQNLIGYDITLEYAPQMLRVVGFDTADTVFCLDAVGVPHSGCRPHSIWAEGVRQSVGLVREASNLNALANAMNVDDITGDLPALIVTFQVITRETHNPALHIFTDGECACQSIEVSGLTGLPHSTNDGAFYGEPNIALSGLHLNSSFGNAMFSLGANETVAGFAFAVFDIIAPNGTDLQVVSNKVILAPGDVRNVSAAFPITLQCSVSCGTYLRLVTLWRGTVDFDMAIFLHFTASLFELDWADWHNGNKVSILDAAQLAFCFDTTPSAPNWSSCKYFDLYLQNKVTILDAALVAFLFDQTSGPGRFLGQGQPAGQMDPMWKNSCSTLTPPDLNYCNTLT